MTSVSLSNNVPTSDIQVAPHCRQCERMLTCCRGNTAMNIDITSAINARVSYLGQNCNSFESKSFPITRILGVYTLNYLIFIA